MTRPAPVADRSDAVTFSLIVTLSILALSLLASVSWADSQPPWRTYYEMPVEADGKESTDCEVCVEESLNPLDVAPGKPDRVRIDAEDVCVEF